MRRKELVDPEKQRADSVENFIFENALGHLQPLSTTPTTSSPLLEEGEAGFVDGDPTTLFIRLQGAIYKWNVTEST